MLFRSHCLSGVISSVSTTMRKVQSPVPRIKASAGFGPSESLIARSKRLKNGTSASKNSTGLNQGRNKEKFTAVSPP